MIYSSANFLDLRVTVKPVVQSDEYKSLFPYFPHSKDLNFHYSDIGYDYGGNYRGRNQFTDLLDEDHSADQRIVWYMMQDSIDSKDDPTLLDPRSIKICGSDSDITWSSVFSLIKTPVKASAEEANVYMNASSFKEAGVCEEDIPTILDA